MPDDALVNGALGALLVVSVVIGSSSGTDEGRSSSDNTGGQGRSPAWQELTEAVCAGQANDRPLKLGAYEGLQARGSLRRCGETRSAILRIYVANERYYNLTVDWTGGNAANHDAEAQQFFDSFRLARVDRQ